MIAFDTETYLLAPGLFAPPLVCLQWKRPHFDPLLTHRDGHAHHFIQEWLAGGEVLSGHNVAFDMCVIANQFPDLLPAIFAKYDRNEIVCTKIREQLIMICRGQFRYWEDAEGEAHPVKYDLDACTRRHFNQPLKKEGFRKFYRIFDQEPTIDDWDRVAAHFQENGRAGHWPQWVFDETTPEDRAGLLAARPEEAREYALGDAVAQLNLHESQDRVAAMMANQFPGVLDDQFRQARSAFALRLSSCWGVHTDPEAVDLLETALTKRYDDLKAELQREGIIRANGTADTSAAREAMIDACKEDGLPVMMTKGGTKPKKDGTVSPPQVSLSAEACGRFEDWSLIGQYSEFLTVRKTLTNDVKMLRAGREVPIQPQYDMADTGRTRAAKPNIQAINRGEGIRECFRPREGTVFIQGDFEGLELHTLAQWCMTTFGHSKLGEALNKKIDVHILTGAAMAGMTYEAAMAAKAAGDPAIKEIRQRAKPVNFGFGGGLGAKKLARYARVEYSVEMTEAEAVAAKRTWTGLYPEMLEHFASAAVATRNPSGLADERHIFTGRWRGGQRYSALCNGRFQGLGADAAKEALWRVTRACYVEPKSPLYGCRVVAFVHDEILAEAPLERAPKAAKELGRLMCAGANVYLKDVPVRVEPLIMARWAKNAIPIYGENGELQVWDAPEE